LKKVLKVITILSVLFITGSILPGYSKAASSVQVFRDVPANHYYYESIYSLYAKQAINGYVDDEGNTYFKPSNTVTRGEAAKMVSTVIGLEVDEVPNYEFKDLDVDAWYYNPIAAMIEQGYLEGYSDHTIKPKGTLTRAEMAKIIAISYGYETTTDNISHFEDVKQDAWYAPYIGALVENGITGGTTDTTFSPGKAIKRQELAAFLDRAHNKVPAEEYNDGQLQNLLSETQVKIDGVIQYYKNVKPERPAYSKIREELLQYAMPSIADDSLKKYYEKSCTQCDHLLFDIPMAFDLHYQVLEHTADKIVIETVSPDNEIESGHMAEIALVNDNGKWKMEDYQSWSFEERPLDISKEKAKRYIKNHVTWLDIDTIDFQRYDEANGTYYFDLYLQDGSYKEVKFVRTTGFVYVY
jgi:S-layer homology domain